MAASSPAGSRPLFKSANPAVIEIARPGFPDGVDGRRIEGRYQSIQTSGDVTVGATQISDGENEFRIEDRWVQASDTAWRVDRTLTVIAANSASGVRLLLDIGLAFAARATKICTISHRRRSTTSTISSGRRRRLPGKPPASASWMIG